MIAPRRPKQPSPARRGRSVRTVRKAEQARWLAENAQAIEQYNEFVEQHGVFGDDLRQF